MPYLTAQRFEGKLSGHGAQAEVTFEAMIDDDGRLSLQLERMPFSRETLRLYQSPEVGKSVDLLTLTGISAEGWHFHSDQFTINHFGHGSEAGRELDFQGDCGMATLRRTLDRPADRSRRLWFIRKLATVHRLAAENELGEIVAGGPHDRSRDSQQPSSFLQITHPTGHADAEWWEASERFLIHLARVMSFSCDSYLLPVMEQRVLGDTLEWTVVRRGNNAAPFLAPFHLTYLEPIFARACASFATHATEVELLDPAIRWLTAPVALWEQRLVSAMTALESILERTAPPGTRQFLSNSSFKKLATKARKLLVDNKAPEGMSEKVPELNRRPFKEQLDALLQHRAIITTDFPSGWLDQVLKARNYIVHTGVAPVTAAESQITFEQIVWPRELVTRLILQKIGYEGSYQSWLHRDKALHFPSCTPMDEWTKG